MCGKTQLFWIDRSDPLARHVLGMDLLFDDERSRRDRFRQAPDRDRFALGRGMTRLALGALLDIAPGALRFEIGTYGRPALLGRAAGPWFNIAHSGDLVVTLVSTASPWIGVDVEADDRGVDVDELADVVLAPSERESLGGLSDDDRRARFFTAWTLKEAYLKAVGVGLQRAPHRQVFDLSARPLALSLDLVENESLNDWQFSNWRLPRLHYLAAAVRGTHLPLPAEAPIAGWCET